MNPDHSLDAIVNRMAQEAYKAYGDSAQWKNFAGGNMPSWDHLPESIRKHWRNTVIIFLPESLQKAAWKA